MGWMNDTLHYMQTDFPWRPGNYRMLTFSLDVPVQRELHPAALPRRGRQRQVLAHHAHARRLLAPVRRHEGPHLLPDDAPRRQAQLHGQRASSQFIEWRYYEAIQYFLAEQYETHRHQQLFVSDLNHFYNDHPALWQRAFSQEGFEWIDADNADQSIITFVRKGAKPGDGSPSSSTLTSTRARTSAWASRSGASTRSSSTPTTSATAAPASSTSAKTKCKDVAWNGREQSVVVRVPPLGGMVLKRTGSLRRPAKKVAGEKKPAAKKAAPAAKQPAADKKSAPAEGKTAAKEPAAKKTAVKATSAKSAAAKKGVDGVSYSGSPTGGFLGAGPATAGPARRAARPRSLSPRTEEQF